MTNRMLVAITVLLLGARATLAQSTSAVAPPTSLPTALAGLGWGQAALPPEPAPATPSSSLPSDPLSQTTPSLARVPVYTAPGGGGTNQAFWADGDFVLSWFRGVSLPPLVTTSATGTPTTAAGVLGQASTRVLFGNGSAEDGVRAGFRLAAGYWFGNDQRFGIEAGYMMLGSQTTSFAASSSAFPILARPYTDATNFTQQAALVAYPGLSKDTLSIQDSSGHFYSGNLDFDIKLVNEGWFRLVALVGWRSFRYDEDLYLNQTILPTSAAFVTGTKIAVTDAFSTTNQFEGLDLGIRPQFVWQSWTVDLLARAAVGNLHTNVNIAGDQTVSAPGFASVTQQGGLYALSTNIGHHPNNDWVVTPEFGIGLGWQVTPNLKLRLGYGVLLLNEIARAADQVNTIINPLHLPGTAGAATGPSQPVFDLQRTDMWIQNVNLGLQFTY